MDATAAFPKENGKEVQDWEYDEEQVIIISLKGKSGEQVFIIIDTINHINYHIVGYNDCYENHFFH